MRMRAAIVAFAVLTLAAPAAAAPAAPAVNVKLLNGGEPFDSRNLLGKKALVLRFQASWCKVCAAEADGLERVYQAYRDRDVEFLAVHIQDTEADARRFLTEHHATYPAGLDLRLRIANRFGFRGTPYTVVVDRRGEMVARIHGSADETRITRTLDAVLTPKPARKPPPKRLQRLQ
jgi:peroxiredoxin